MGELIDLIVDFERKLVLLLKDLWAAPARIVQSVVTKDRKYLSPFKFYSLVFSLWIIIVQGWNRWDGSFYDSNPTIPARLAGFKTSYLEFMFLIAPLLFFIYWIIFFGFVGFLVLRKPKYTLLNHMSFATYIGGMVLLLLVPSIGLTYALGDLSSNGEFVQFLALFSIPLAFVLQFTWRVYTHRVWAVAKVVVAIVFISAFTAHMMVDSDFHSFIFKKVAYAEYARHDIRDDGAGLVDYIPVTSGQFVENYNFLNSHYSNTRIAYRMNDNEDSVSYFLVKHSNHDSLVARFHQSVASFEPGAGQEGFYDNNWHGIDLNDTLALITYSCGCANVDSYIWRFNPLARGSSGRIPAPYLLPSSQFYRTESSILFTGHNPGTLVPVIGRLNPDNTIEILDSLEVKPGFQIDSWLIEKMDDSLSVQMTLFQNDHDRLKGISLISGTLADRHFTPHSEVVLLKNDFSASLNSYDDNNTRFPLHNSRLLRADSLHSILVYQVMTDTSFAFNIHKLRTDGEEVWQRTVVIPADFSFYHHALIHDENLILLGDVATYFTKGWNIGNTIHKFMLTFDLQNGKKEGLYFFTEEADYFFGLESLYPSGHAFQDERYIYWSSNSGRGSFRIDKSHLFRRQPGGLQ